VRVQAHGAGPRCGRCGRGGPPPTTQQENAALAATAIALRQQNTGHTVAPFILGCKKKQKNLCVIRGCTCARGGEVPRQVGRRGPRLAWSWWDTEPGIPPEDSRTENTLRV